MVYRGSVRHEAAWDLMALVIVGSLIGTVYQVRQKTLGQGWVWKAMLLTIVGAFIGFIVAAILALSKFK